MAWDSSRPIPWKQLLRLVAIFIVLFNLFVYFSKPAAYGLQTIIPTLAAGGLYLAVAAILAKFGLDPVSQRNARIRAAQERREAKLAENPPAAKQKTRGGKAVPPPKGPAPTKRTNSTNRQRPRK
jgi:hypothetical protein